ncbi:hypothetical protein RI129_011970 [Pyrocoelia pectoralis]|uniref:DUF4806 domain-containing protein n=1 Tax=Pyrocoelia pectoralis TaxID=417401 RepID=A0AAN7V2X8_9COLE
MTTYVGIEFDDADGGGIAVISEKWITPKKKEVFWPPYKTQKAFNTALEKRDSPESNWSIYSIKRRFFESDIQTDKEEDNCKIRRRRRPPKKFANYDDDYSDDSANGNIQQNRNVKCNARGINLARPPTVVYLPQSVDGGGFNNLLHNKESETTVEHVNNSYSISNCSVNSFVPSVPVESFDVRTPTSSNCTSPSLSSSSTIAQNNKNQDKFLNILLTIQEQNKQILAKLNENFSSSPTVPPNLPVLLPIDTIERLEKLEKHLEVEENFKKLSAYMSSIGGKDLVSKVNGVLKKLLSNRIAKHFNFYGKREKKAFQNLRMNALVLEAIKTSSKGATEKEVENVIKVWLKHAPQRDSLDSKKKSGSVRN